MEESTSIKTRVIDAINKQDKELEEILEPAVRDILVGNPVGIPTETVYGLAANALNPLACQRIYTTKNRPADNPLIVHISSWDMLKSLIRSSTTVEEAIPHELLPVLKKFWPGPLTVLLPKNEHLHDIVTAGLGTVAVRFPSHPIAKKLIEMANVPLAAPSANLSGRPSPTSAQHVLQDLDGRINYVVDGGPSGFGIESTVLDATRSPPLILRPGSITQRMLQEFLPNVQVFNKDSANLTAQEVKQIEERPATPGMKYRHYSPTSPVLLFSSEPDTREEDVEEEISSFVRAELNSGKRIARITIKPTNPPLHDDLYLEIPLSKEGCQVEMARNLFGALRAADSFSPSLIVAQAIEETDEGLAIMNRLSKATSAIRTIPRRNPH